MVQDHIRSHTCIQSVITSFFFQKILMITALDDLSILQNHDGVGVAHGGEAVGDHKGGPFCHQTVHALLDVLFRSRIDGARRLDRKSVV